MGSWSRESEWKEPDSSPGERARLPLSHNQVQQLRKALKDLIKPVGAGNFQLSFWFFSWQECFEGGAEQRWATQEWQSSPNPCLATLLRYGSVDREFSQGSWAAITHAFPMRPLCQESFSQGPCWFKQYHLHISAAGTETAAHYEQI